MYKKRHNVPTTPHASDAFTVPLYASSRLQPRPPGIPIREFPGIADPQNSRRKFPGISEILAGITRNFESFVFFPLFLLLIMTF